MSSLWREGPTHVCRAGDPIQRVGLVRHRTTPERNQAPPRPRVQVTVHRNLRRNPRTAKRRMPSPPIPNPRIPNRLTPRLLTADLPSRNRPRRREAPKRKGDPEKVIRSSSNRRRQRPSLSGPQLGCNTALQANTGSRRLARILAAANKSEIRHRDSGFFSAISTVALRNPTLSPAS